MLFIMLNPSTADGEADDPTIRKCVGFARRQGFGGIEVVNLYAYRATDPADLKRAGYPIGPHNNLAINAALAHSGYAFCAWGANAKGHRRAREVYDLVVASGAAPCALRVNGDGTPAHPLMLPYTCEPVWFAMP